MSLVTANGLDPYLALKWLHILSSTLLFGTGIGTALHLWLTHRSGDVRAIAVAADNTVRADWWFTLPSGIVQPVSGFGLVYLAGYGRFESWLALTYAIYAVALGCWLAVVWLQLRIRAVARTAVVSGTPLPAAYHRMIRAWFWLGWPAFLGLTAIFWLMVNKPALW